MTQERRKLVKTTHRAEILLWSILGSVIMALAFGGWAARDFVDTKLASKDQVVVVGLKADFVIDQQMAAVIGQIAYLERKPRKTQDEINQLNYLRQQLDIMRKVRSGK